MGCCMSAQATNAHSADRSDRHGVDRAPWQANSDPRRER